MPAYDTPPPPPTDLLRIRPQRSGPVLAAIMAVFLILLFSLLGFRWIRLENAAAAPREKSIEKAKKLAQAALLYAEDHNVFPGSYDIEARLKPYGVSAADFKSPLETWTRYSIRDRADRRPVATIPSPETFAIFFDGFGGGPHIYGMSLENAWSITRYRQDGKVGNVFSFADGHAAFVPQEDWNPDDLSVGPVR